MGSFVAHGNVVLGGAAGSVPASTDHNALSNLTVGDVHTQYVKVTGRATPQVISLGTAASATAGVISSTSDVTKGSMTVGGVTIKESTGGRLGLNNTNPSNFIEIGSGAISWSGTPTIVGTRDGISAGDGTIRQFTVGISRVETSATKQKMVAIQLQRNKGANVASAAAIVPSDGNFFIVTGTTNIDHMSVLDVQAGTDFTLEFAGILTVNNETGSPPANHVAFKLDAGANFTTAAGDNLEVTYNGTEYRQTGGSIA